MNNTDQVYYPASESKGGWRYLLKSDEILEIGGIDPEKLKVAIEMQHILFGSHSWGIVIIRNGYLVSEFYTTNVLIPTRFDIWSGTKSFTSTAFGCLFNDSLNTQSKVNLDSLAYQFIPEGYPLSDPRKEDITIGHLLSMSSGIPGQAYGLVSVPTTIDCGTFEHVLGKSPNRYGRWADKLTAEPGTYWDYSDPGFAHLSIIFKNIVKCEMRDYVKQRIFDPIGIEGASWELQGGSGFLGPYTNAHTGIHMSARELARFGYLCLQNGVWEGEQVIPKWWLKLATQTSQDMKTSYGYGWWVNTHGTCWPDLPQDSYMLSGYRANRCYIIPSLDLVVARIGSGPPAWDENMLISEIVNAIV